MKTWSYPCRNYWTLECCSPEISQEKFQDDIFARNSWMNINKPSENKLGEYNVDNCSNLT